MPSLGPWGREGLFSGSQPRGLEPVALPSPSIRKAARARMTVAALQGKQKGRPKVRSFLLSLLSPF